MAYWECADGFLRFILVFSQKDLDCLQFTVEGIEDQRDMSLGGSSDGVDADRLSY